MALDEITLWDSLDNLKDPELEQCTIHTTEDALQALQDTESYIVSRFFDKLVRLSGNDIAEIQPIIEKLANLQEEDLLSGNDWFKLLKLLQDPRSKRFVEIFAIRYKEFFKGIQVEEMVMDDSANLSSMNTKKDHLFYEGPTNIGEGHTNVGFKKVIEYVIKNTEKVDNSYIAAILNDVGQGILQLPAEEVEKLEMIFSFFNGHARWLHYVISSAPIIEVKDGSIIVAGDRIPDGTKYKDILNIFRQRIKDKGYMTDMRESSLWKWIENTWAKGGVSKT